MATVTTLNREGDYLVLFQTVGASGLPTYTAGLATELTPDAPIFAYTDLEPAVRDGLDGRPVSCGSFVGVWSPARD